MTDEEIMKVWRDCGMPQALRDGDPGTPLLFARALLASPCGAVELIASYRATADGFEEIATRAQPQLELLMALQRLEVAANTVNYCYEKRPENFAAALQSLRNDAAFARAVIAATGASQ